MGRGDPAAHGGPSLSSERYGSTLPATVTSTFTPRYRIARKHGVFLVLQRSHVFVEGIDGTPFARTESRGA